MRLGTQFRCRLFDWMRCLANDVYKITFRLQFASGTRLKSGQIEIGTVWTEWKKKKEKISRFFKRALHTKHFQLNMWMRARARIHTHMILARFDEHFSVWMMSVQSVQVVKNGCLLHNINEIWVKWLTKMNERFKVNLMAWKKKIFTSDTQMMRQPFKTDCLIIGT